LTISYFVTGFNHQDLSARLRPGQLRELADFLTGMPGLDRAEIGVPAEVQTYHGDNPVPTLTLRLDFATLPQLERVLAEGGRLHRLAASALWSTLPLDQVSQQAMLRRCFLDHLGSSRSGATDQPGCDYQVHYPGQADDFNAWLRHYLRRHAAIMTTFPEVRSVDVFTRVDWCDAMPWQRVGYMQRNRIAFDSPQQLLAALASPVRERMRQDHGAFPAYAGGSRHYPMLVTRLPGA
jgi:hypothetical protein